MHHLIVVNNPKNWGFRIPGVEVVSARTYLTEQHYSNLRHVRVHNLCRSYRYLSLGYYVSLLAEARGHRPLPTINTIQDARSPAIVRVLSDDLDALIQKSFATLQSKRFTLSIYFGQNVAKRYQSLSLQLFNLFPAPLLRAQFVRKEKWEIQSVQIIPSNDVPHSHRLFVETAAGDFFSGPGVSRRRRKQLPYDLAILATPQDENPPSDKTALKRFSRAAEKHGMKTTFITKDDFGRIAEFDALFIRDTTYVNHYTYRFASRAAAEGLVVVDDPQSIVRCTNKVYLAELLTRHGLPTPKTLVVHEDNLEAVARVLTYPCILKRPDSSFSQGVHKAEDVETFRREAARILADSDLLIVQEFVPTPFDWRVGIFDRKPLFVCRYFMAPRHWQIIHWDESGEGRGGKCDTLRVEDAPRNVVRMALLAANLIGDGFYGVDLKPMGRSLCVIEINDNPSIESGCEDLALKTQLYEQIMGVFRGRIEKRRQSRQSR